MILQLYGHVLQAEYIPRYLNRLALTQRNFMKYNALVSSVKIQDEPIQQAMTLSRTAKSLESIRNFS